MVYRAAVKTGVVFEGREEQGARPRSSSPSCSQDENLTPYVEGSLGRWFPVTTAATQRPFWQADPHRRSVYNQFNAGTVTFEFTKNYKFTIAQQRERLGQGDEPRRQRQGAGRQGGRRDDRPHQGGRRLRLAAGRSVDGSRSKAPSAGGRRRPWGRPRRGLARRWQAWGARAGRALCADLRSSSSSIRSATASGSRATRRATSSSSTTRSSCARSSTRSSSSSSPST